MNKVAKNIDQQYTKPQLAIHSIVDAAIELGCTDKLEISCSALLSLLAHKSGEAQDVWNKRLSHACSDESKTYVQYFCKVGEQITFHPAVWKEMVRYGWACTGDCVTNAVLQPTLAARPIAGKRASVNIAAWGTFALEVIGSAASDKNKTGYFRADVGIERLKSAAESGATFLFVHVAGSITRAFAISAYTLQQACLAHKVSVNYNGTPRYELYINYRKGQICKNAGPDGFVADFDNTVNS